MLFCVVSCASERSPSLSLTEKEKAEGFQNVPDVMFAHADYPDINGLGGFTLSLGANYVDGISKKWGSTDFRIIGEKGVMDVRWDSVAVKTAGPTETACFGALEHCRRTAKAPVKISDCEHVIEAGGDNRGGHYNHFENFFRCIESGVRPAGDAVFGAQTASVALLCYESYLRGGALRWDSENLKIV